MNVPRGLGILMLGLAGSFWLAGAMLPAFLRLPLWWTAGAAAVGALLYFLNLPGVLGKKAHGAVAWPSLVLMWPYMLVSWLVWRVQRAFGGEDTFNQVAPGLYVGRRAYLDELPEDVAMVVDLTCELPEVRQVRERFEYRSLPTMDGGLPRCAQAYLALADEIAAFDRPVYVHCAVGHGRAAMFAAAVVIRRGLAATVREAVALLREGRSVVKPNGAQMDWMEAALARAATLESEAEAAVEAAVEAAGAGYSAEAAAAPK